MGAAAPARSDVGSAALLLIGGTGMGAGYGSVIGDSTQTGRLALAALAYWPAVMVFVGIAVALFGWLPRLSPPLPDLGPLLAASLPSAVALAGGDG